MHRSFLENVKIFYLKNTPVKICILENEKAILPVFCRRRTGTAAQDESSCNAK